MLLACTCAISFIGACIGPGPTSIHRLIVANIFVGVGFAAVPLAYAVPSEILPRRWHPSAQAGINIAALLANCSAPLVIGALTTCDAHTGWRYYYVIWFQAALWGATTVAIFIGYHPPKRHTDLDHLSLRQKISSINLTGCGLFTAGLALFTAGTGLSGGVYSWTNARTLAAMIFGVVTLFTFEIQEWKRAKTGFLNHELFVVDVTSTDFCPLCCIDIPGGYHAFRLWTFLPDPAAWVPAIVSIVLWGYVGSRFRTVREPLIIGFILFTAGLVGLSTIQPGQSINAIAFSCLFGIGFGAALALIVTGVQLSTLRVLTATATACTTSSRAVAGAMFSAIYTAAFNTRLKNSIADFIQALSEDDTVTLDEVPGVTPTIIALCIRALRQAYADSFRVVFIIAVPFGVVACIASCFLGDLSETMNYHVDAPIEVPRKQGRG
ncbi:siderophore iron transporter [Talaromyces pinophilus]|uniref:Siderophore iron transporter n=1 Tax=Talaromyces pinophilus TaxID=128442 RepID=A0A0B8MYJ8_TALPI|nr:siderophore iron transporter [Talaromyces pinophilus]